MQIVIDIPKDAYDYVMGCGYFPSNFNMLREIRKGTVLPEHGRLIDADAFILSHFGNVVRLVNDAPTILEAWWNEI